MSLQRIDKIVASQEIVSRSEVKAMIRKGRIKANGSIVKRPDEKYDPDTSEISIDGRKIIFKKYMYIMMNKPAGVLSASRDSHERTVIDILPAELRRPGLFPAGRLDKDTEGLLIITDDGEFAHKILSPKSHIYKLYLAQTDKVLTAEDEQAFIRGIKSGDVDFLPAGMKRTGERTALVEICEGKFHQVKKMFAALGATVVSLKRLRMGGLYLDEKLSPGEFRELNNDEIMLLSDLKCDFLEK